jgi:hypothetical protein
MVTLILVLLAAGIIAGLMQFFVDYKKLPLYDPSGQTTTEEFVQERSFWQRLYDFIRKHWQFFGYITIGIAGAFLVPVIDQLVGLNGIKEYLNCIDDNDTTPCVTGNWYLMVILGYGIIFGYSSVRLIRGLGSFLIKTTNPAPAPNPAPVPTPAPTPENAGISNALQDATPNSGDDESVIFEAPEAAAFSSCIQNPNPTPWRDWRAAASLKTLLNTINTLAPGRNKASDGMIGDLAHQSRNSDHNPWVWDSVARKGVVTALDVTHDPAGKCDCGVLAKSLETGKDNRIKYVIWNKQIMNSSSINGSDPWTWRPYTGANPHTKHIHISVKCDKSVYDVTSPWTVQTK